MTNEERYRHDPQFKAANDIYSLYFIGWLLGFLAFIIGGVWAWRKMLHTSSGISVSHFRFQMAMAVQGGLVLAMLTVIIVLSHWLAFSLPWGFTPLSVAIYIWWWLWRSIAGYRILAQQQAIANPKTWGKPHAESLQEDNL